MHRLWETVVEPLLRAAEPLVIVEIGCADGAQTERLLELAQSTQATVHVVDPAPDLDVAEWERRHGSRLVFHREKSLEALPRIPGADVVLIDGDHNWHTVTGELRLIEEAATEADRQPPLVLAHDVGWPYGRRDTYWDPDAIPEQERQPYERLGLLLGEAKPDESAGLNRHLLNAIYEGTPRNGVLTALEDFRTQSEIDWDLRIVPGIHGLGVLASAALLESNPALAERVSELGQPSLLSAQLELVESSRLELAIRLEDASVSLRALEQRNQELEREAADDSTEELEHRVGELLEELEISAAEAQRLRADIQRADQREAEMRGSLEAMRAELTSGRVLEDTAREDQRTDGESALRRSLQARYAPVAERFAELGADGDLGFALSQDGHDVLAPAGAAGPTGMSVDVIVCVHNARDDVRRCLRSLLAAGGHPFHLIVIDDGSDAPTRRLVDWFARAHPHVDLVRNAEPPHGYTIAANLGLGKSTADRVVLLNSDTLVTPGWLEEMLLGWDADETIGIVGPLSNAATHQSVPAVKDGGGWADNPLPAWLSADGLAFLLQGMSEGQLPRVPFVNGFCFGLSRSAIEKVGLFDEELFAEGFCEENDYAVRARDAGFSLAISDRSYVHHAKSRSYGSERRKRIADDHYERFLEKHGRERVEALLSEFDTAAEELAPLRERLGEVTSAPAGLERAFGSIDPEPLAVTYVLPGLPKGGGGGTHSVYQEVKALRGLGVPAGIALASGDLERASDVYDEAADLFSGYGSADELAELTAGSDVVVATHHRSVAAIEALRRERRDFLPAYYVQDYEPFFSEDGSSEADEALLSYRALPDLLVFAKTDWLCSVIAAQHGIQAAKVRPSLDTEVFHTRGRIEASANGSLRLAAMIRPRTPRRQPRTTLDLLERARRELGDDIEVVTFGCTQQELEGLGADTGAQVHHRGPLTRTEVADVLRGSDVFVDLSSYQAFGRTGLESMACGCTALLPAIGGVTEYARDGIDSFLVETGDVEGCLAVIRELANDRRRVSGLQAAATETASGYSTLGAALSEYVLFRNAHRRLLGEVRPTRTRLGAA